MNLFKNVCPDGFKLINKCDARTGCRTAESLKQKEAVGIFSENIPTASFCFAGV